MNKLLLIGVLLYSTATVFAQATERTEEYCEFTLEGTFASGGKCAIRLDYGQEHTGLLGLAGKLRDESGKPVLFNSAVEALNYLNGYGWELVTVHKISSDTYYVMRRRAEGEVRLSAPNQRTN